MFEIFVGAFLGTIFGFVIACGISYTAIKQVNKELKKDRESSKHVIVYEF